MQGFKQYGDDKLVFYEKKLKCQLLLMMSIYQEIKAGKSYLL